MSDTLLTKDIAERALVLLTGPMEGKIRDVFALEGIICYLAARPGIVDVFEVDILELIQEIVTEAQGRAPGGSLFEALNNIHRMCENHINDLVVV